MMKIFKKAVAAAVVLCILTVLSAFSLGEVAKAPDSIENDNIKIVINGNEIENTNEAFLENDRLFIPARTVCEVLGCDVSWDNETKKATVIKGERKMELEIGKNDILADGDMVYQGYSAPVLRNGTLYISIRSLEAIGCDVGYDLKSKTVFANEKISLNGGQSFDSKLYAAANESEDGNFMISPISIKMALMLLANGMDEAYENEISNICAGKSIDEYNEYLKDIIKIYSDLNQGEINIANSIWVNEDRAGSPLNKEYQKKVFDYYNAAAKQVNNANAVSKINEFVRNNTKGKIDNIINSNDFTAALVNAVYFKCDWEHEFDKNDTCKQDFTNADKSVSNVDFMHKTFNTRYGETEDIKMAELPYKGGRFSMYVAVCGDKTDPDDIISLVKSDKIKRVKVRLSIPKFKSEYMRNITNDIKKAGITAPFVYGCKKMFEQGEDTVAADAFHKTYIEVDERGTEAAAATVIKVETTAFEPENIVTFTADKPFTYFIYDNENEEVLFLGRQNKM